MCVFVSSKPKNKKNRVENLSRMLQKQKRKKNIKQLSFISQFIIEILILFTSCKKVLGKMPGLENEQMFR